MHLQLAYNPIPEIKEHAIKTLAQILIITGLVTKLIRKGRFGERFVLTNSATLEY